MNKDAIFAEQSSILLRILFGNFDFANDFLTKKHNFETIRSNGIDLRQPSVEHFYIDNYLDSVGNFSASATDWKEISFVLFISAFNEFFELYVEFFVNFFDKYIFNKTLKQLSNEYVNNLFSGEEFTILLNDIYLKDKFLMSRMIGHNFARAMIQKFTLIRENSIQIKRDRMNFPNSVAHFEEFYNLSQVETQQGIYSLDKYLYDFENMTVLFANSEQKYNSGGLYLPSYFDIVTLE